MLTRLRLRVVAFTKRAGTLFVDNMIGSISVVAVSALLATIGLSSGTGGNAHKTHKAVHTATIPSLPDQWRREKSQIVEAGWTVTHQIRANLRDDGTMSTILSLKKQGLCDASVGKASDELRIYDEIDGRLIRSLIYTPSGCQGPLSRIASMDLFDTGRAELVSSITQASLHVPIVIYWRDEKDQYQLSPLIMAPPDVSVPNDPSPTLERERERTIRPYLEPIVVIKGLQPGYGFADFFVRSGSYENPPRVVGLYRIGTAGHARSQGTRRLYERTAWSLQQIGTEVLSDACRIRSERRVVNAKPGLTEHRIIESLVDHWQNSVETCN